MQGPSTGNLAITIDASDSPRPERWAATDRRGGFIELDLFRSGAGQGYLRKEVCYFSDIVLSDPSGRKLRREKAKRIEVLPEGLYWQSALPSGGDLTIGVHLVLEEGNLVISFSRSLPPAWRVALLLPESSVRGLESGEVRLHWGEEAARWTRGRAGSFAPPSFPRRAAGGKRPVLILVDGQGRGEDRVSGEGRGDSEGRELILSFEEGAGPEVGRSGAPLSESLSRHRRRVEEMLSGPSLKSDRKDFDRALAWAHYSGRLLVVKEEGSRGIWAGLPWFRDNWGRDTFIALSGISLCRGNWAEAREILESFAALQDRNPESPTKGRIPNRYRFPDEAIYNTVDGSLWFIRALFEYGEASGDRSFMRSLAPAVFRVLDADLGRRDATGFLLHADADTWMDARIEGKEAWSRRGDRAVEVQALFYAALLAGARIAALEGLGEVEGTYRRAAALLRSNFLPAFYDEESGLLADRLLPAASGEAESAGEARAPSEVKEGPRRDLRVRPNQFLALFAPLPLVEAGEPPLVERDIEERILASALPELVYPWGVSTLSQSDPFFHRFHENPRRWHKDAAYHNGTVWDWLLGPTASLLVRSGRSDLAWTLLEEAGDRMLRRGCAGSLSECADAHPRDAGPPRLSGTYSQAWSLSEFARISWRDFLGFRPHLFEGRILLSPRLPPGIDSLEAEAPLWEGGQLSVSIRRDGDGIELRLALSGEPPEGGRLGLRLELADAMGSASYALELEEGRPLRLAGRGSKCLRFGAKEGEEELAPVETAGHSPLAASLRFASAGARPWCRAEREKDWLKRLILGGNYDSGPSAWLAEWYSSPAFHLRHADRRALGAMPETDRTRFRLWAPLAEELELEIYDSSEAEEPIRVALPFRPRRPLFAGTWEIELPGNLGGSYYLYRAKVFGRRRSLVDPYARSAGADGRRAMVVDFSRLEPEGWAGFASPRLEAPNDALIYEAHVRDLSAGPAWGGPSELLGKYLGFAQPGTRAREGGAPTGFDHLRELGVTHVQLLPLFDFDSVPEAEGARLAAAGRRRKGLYNWGYDPFLLCAPEGSYSSDPRDGRARVRELRELVLRLGEAGMGVVMDVVYNHVPRAEGSPLDGGAPGYFFRPRSFSGAGIDLASERPMVRRFIIASLEGWLRDYRLSGFRFDLMGLLDLGTMRRAARRLRALKPDLLIYGEGWDMFRGKGPAMASQKNVDRLPRVGMFNDAFRDAIKGSCFEARDPGFIHGGGREASLRFGLVGAQRHPQVDNKAVTGTANPRPWGRLSGLSVNYAEVHDNLCLADKNRLVSPGSDEEALAQLQELALGLVILSQGLPFLHAGGEFLRSKEIPPSWLEDMAGGRMAPIPDLDLGEDGRAFSHNSYDLSDEVNGIDWNLAVLNAATLGRIRRIISLRREHPLFRLRSGREIRKRLRFLEGPAGLLAWTLKGPLGGESWKEALVVAAAEGERRSLALPGGPAWKPILLERNFPPSDATPIPGGSLLGFPPRSLSVLARPLRSRP